jgi:hypothetical protein
VSPTCGLIFQPGKDAGEGGDLASNQCSHQLFGASQWVAGNWGKCGGVRNERAIKCQKSRRLNQITIKRSGLKKSERKGLVKDLKQNLKEGAEGARGDLPKEPYKQTRIPEEGD